MAFSNLEKAMAAYIGLDLAAPGVSRAAVKAALGVTARRAVAPTAVGIGGLARRYPITAAGLAGYGAYEAGLLDPLAEPFERGVRAFDEVVVKAPERRRKKQRTKFNKAVSQGMKAVKASTSYGKNGVINNSKKAFSAVTKVASKLNSGKKVSSKGVSGVIKRKIGKLFPKSKYNPKRRTRRTGGSSTKWSIKVN